MMADADFLFEVAMVQPPVREKQPPAKGKATRGKSREQVTP
jgi:hypothetical protein